MKVIAINGSPRKNGNTSAILQGILDEGLLEFEAIRDYLYARMRGSHDRPSAAPQSAATSPGFDGTGLRELASALREVTAELRAVREALERRQSGGNRD